MGIIHTFSAIFCFFSIFLFGVSILDKINYKFFKRFIFFVLTTILGWFLWKIYLISSGVSLHEYSNFGDHGLRFYIFKDFIFQLLIKFLRGKLQ